ncbi:MULTISPECIES: hypothetical protein [Bacillus]|uniref:hypothetical protein n=1 Tax=Bacillus TaxID=1386 RepID=UPI001F56657F|nr:hypothetical protein [Bacillus cereus group sp. BfR-BA-01317]HDR7922165.1 hypothetical protein [Bacillus paranthracis]
MMKDFRGVEITHVRTIMRMRENGKILLFEYDKQYAIEKVTKKYMYVRNELGNLDSFSLDMMSPIYYERFFIPVTPDNFYERFYEAQRKGI